MKPAKPDTRPLCIALFTYSTRPRGGVVHTLTLAEHLQALGHDVHIYALGKDEQQTFFRPTPVPFTLIPTVASHPDEPMDERIQRYIHTYYQFLADHRPGRFDLYHTQDCVSANALWRLRQAEVIPAYIRTVHHVDEFVSPSLIECQNNSIYRPDHRIVVSRYWQKQLNELFKVESTVIHNGVDTTRFQPANAAQGAAARARWELGDSWVLLNIGGIEPRKNSIRLLRAFETVRQTLAATGRRCVLLLAGGETLLDYTPYRAEFFEILERSDLQVGRDIILPGVVPDDDIPLLYQAADILAFPSVKEGWGLVALEAMASGLPILTGDIPVFREYLRSEVNALLVDPYSEPDISAGLLRLVTDSSLRHRLAAAGPTTAAHYSWTATATAHVDYYRTIFVEQVANLLPHHGTG